MLRFKPLDKKDFVTAYDVWRKIYTVHPLDLPDWLQPDALLVSIDNVKSAVNGLKKDISKFRTKNPCFDAWIYSEIMTLIHKWFEDVIE